MPVINRRAPAQGLQSQEGAEPNIASSNEADLESSGDSHDMQIDEEESKEPASQFLAPSSSGGQTKAGETCKVCYSADADAAFIPCGHVTACIKCAQRCQTCPTCRTPYHDIMKLYR